MTRVRDILQPAIQAAAEDQAQPPVDASVCILNWNGAAVLADCLRSLRDIRELNGSTFEIIVVDNGSADDSVAMVKRDFPEVRLLSIPKNIGISAATNEGLRIGRGRYSLILNNDIVLKSDCIDRMVKFLDEHPKAGIAGGRLLNRDGSTQIVYYPRMLPTVRSIAAELFRLRRGTGIQPAEWDPETTCQMEQVPGACIMVRDETFKKIGLWDEGFSCWYEDVDFCCRCLAAGWEIWYLADAKVTHLGGSTFQGLGMSQKTLWRFHGLLRYCRKHFSPIRFAAVKFLVLATLVMRLPIVAVLSLSPNSQVRKAWKGIVPAYSKMIFRLVGAQE